MFLTGSRPKPVLGIKRVETGTVEGLGVTRAHLRYCGRPLGPPYRVDGVPPVHEGERPRLVYESLVSDDNGNVDLDSPIFNSYKSFFISLLDEREGPFSSPLFLCPQGNRMVNKRVRYRLRSPVPLHSSDPQGRKQDYTTNRYTSRHPSPWCNGRRNKRKCLCSSVCYRTTYLCHSDDD